MLPFFHFPHPLLSLLIARFSHGVFGLLFFGLLMEPPLIALPLCLPIGSWSDTSDGVAGGDPGVPNDSEEVEATHSAIAQSSYCCKSFTHSTCTLHGHDSMEGL